MFWLTSPFWFGARLSAILAERAQRRTAQAMAHQLAVQACRSLPSTGADKLG